MTAGPFIAAGRFTTAFAGRRRAAAAALLSLLTALAPGSSHGLPMPPMDQPRLSAGVFLVAKPSLQDPRFRKTVILITVHNEQGTIGLIINRETHVRLRDVLPDVDEFKNRDDHLFVGGPVNPDFLFSLIRSAHPPKTARRVVGKVYFIPGLEGLKQVLSDKDPQVAVRSYAGYSGWGAGQLRAEIARGDWLVIDADSDAIFDKDPRKVWHDLIRDYNGQWI